MSPKKHKILSFISSNPFLSLPPNFSPISSIAFPNSSLKVTRPAISAVIPMIGKQREINKSHQIMLHNANLASNLRWLYTKEST